MNDCEKIELMSYIKEHLEDTPKEIQMFAGGSLSTIRKYKKIILRKKEKKMPKDTNDCEENKELLDE